MNVTQIGHEIIAQAINMNIVSYNRYGVGSFRIADEVAARFTFDRYGVCDGTYGKEGSFQVRRRNGNRAAYVTFND